MRRPVFACLTALLAAACSSPPQLPPRALTLLAEAPEDHPARLTFSGGHVIATAIALGPGTLSPTVKATIDAVAPGGEEVFRGREWSARGQGFRIEKRYEDAGTEHIRTALIADDGRVLERAHSVAIAEVPKEVLIGAMQAGSTVELALIVSGSEREEYWQCEVSDRLGRTFDVRVGLDGTVLEVRRRVRARVNV
ncbi:MAG: hypothetical protein NXI31_14100 [bacterium]|nr:hypothetical protein [bacterium]